MYQSIERVQIYMISDVTSLQQVELSLVKVQSIITSRLRFEYSEYFLGCIPSPLLPVAELLDHVPDLEGEEKLGDLLLTAGHDVAEAGEGANQSLILAEDGENLQPMF